jgi:alanyl-tRNA synthetase
MLLRSAERVRSATRVEFVCGVRAVRRARKDFESLTRIAASLSAALDDVAPLVTAQSERLKESDNARKKVEKELSSFRARELYDRATPDANGVRTIVIRDVATMDELRTLAQGAFEFQKAVVVGVLRSPPSVLLAASEDSQGATGGGWWTWWWVAAHGTGRRTGRHGARVARVSSRQSRVASELASTASIASVTRSTDSVSSVGSECSMFRPMFP